MKTITMIKVTVKRTTGSSVCFRCVRCPRCAHGDGLLCGKVLKESEKERSQQTLLVTTYGTQPTKWISGSSKWVSARFVGPLRQNGSQHSPTNLGVETHFGGVETKRRGLNTSCSHKTAPSRIAFFTRRKRKLSAGVAYRTCMFGCFTDPNCVMCGVVINTTTR